MGKVVGKTYEKVVKKPKKEETKQEPPKKEETKQAEE